MTKPAIKPHTAEGTQPVVLHGAERRKIWEKARGMWKNRKPDPIQEHKQIRKELDRQFPC